MLIIKKKVKQPVKCSKPNCNRDVWAHVSDKAYCVIHYRAERSKLKDAVLKQIIFNAREVKAKNPQYAEIIDKIIVPGAENLFRETREKKTSQAHTRRSPPRSKDDIRAELAEVRSQMATLTEIIQKLADSKASKK